MKVILFADDDPDFLKTRAEFLEREGYHVIPATDPIEARRVLERGDIELAILDIRLQDDDDEKDVSGLTLAKEVARLTPKIILTRFPDVDAVRAALTTQSDGLPPAVDFIAKEEGSEALIRAIQRALGPEVVTWLQKVKEAVGGTDKELKEDYDGAQRQSSANYVASLVVAVLGVVTVFVGIALMFSDRLEIGIAGTVAGIVTEAVSLLFFRRMRIADDRMERYHRERIDGQRFETLLQACDGLDSKQRRERCRERVVTAAIEKWLGASDGGQISPGTRESEENYEG